jgi:hypothetical protein
MSSSYPVSQFEIARYVAKSLEDLDPGMRNKSLNSANVLKVLNTIAKFVSHFFRYLSQGNQYNTIICEIPVFGTFVA